MITISIPVTLQQQKESPLIEIVSEEEDHFPTKVFVQEQGIEINDPVVILGVGDGKNSPHHHVSTYSKREYSFTNGSSSNRTLRTIT